MSIPSFILGSASPARAQLLANENFEFIIEPADIDEEKYQAEYALDLVKLLALEKAKKLSSCHGQTLILTADTLVVNDVNGKEVIIGKPKDINEAKAILNSLSGTTHRVITALCLYNPKYQDYIIEAETTYITFRKLSANEINEYITSGESMGKSGAYGIQAGAKSFVKEIKGNIDNVVGLPMDLFKRMLKKIC